MPASLGHAIGQEKKNVDGGPFAVSHPDKLSSVGGGYNNHVIDN